MGALAMGLPSCILGMHSNHTEEHHNIHSKVVVRAECSKLLVLQFRVRIDI